MAELVEGLGRVARFPGAVRSLADEALARAAPRGRGPALRTHPGRRDHRNGCYHRTLVTELGAIIDLAVPRARELRYRPSFLARAARRTTTVDDVLRQAFLRGLSTRETARWPRPSPG